MTFPLMIILLLAVLLAVMLYNFYQEQRYRRQIRRQFGHSDHDALLGSQTQSVRDGQYLTGKSKIAGEQESAAPVVAKVAEFGKAQPELAEETPLRKAADAAEENPVSEKQPAEPAATEPSEPLHTAHTMPFSLIEEEAEELKELLAAETETTEPVANEQKKFQFDNETSAIPNKEASSRRLLVELDGLARAELPWFDERFDYLAYVALYQPKELQRLPRLSGNGNGRFQIAGCTMDGRFQLAEPIPGVHYQAFVIGLQAISRAGLLSDGDLHYFQKQVQQFAEEMDGRVHFKPLHRFLKAAQPFDELCERVDQTIAIHLVSSTQIAGDLLRHELENSGFVLQEDGSFATRNKAGDPEYVVVTLDGTAFTEALLAQHSYKGFSMLFDITRIADGADKFNRFMALAVKLSGAMNLQLVDDHVRQLSTDWLKEVRSYVQDRQEEMLRANIEPGSALAKRLFS